ncbi:MAG: hypothetical protein H6R26_243 [Proteobacteria bacterium]|nr:hypothetical protein [Pseudomonadota bacterium]
MRTIFTVAISAIAVASASGAYYLFRDDASPESPTNAKPSISSTSAAQLQEASIREGRDQLNDGDRSQLKHLNERIAELEAKLRYMETSVSNQANDAAVSAANKAVPKKRAEKTKSKPFSEADFSHWMDEALSAGYGNRDTTKLIMEKMEKTLATVPDIELTDMQCGDRFCRATVTAENGKQPDISQLMGASTDIGSATTIVEPNGSVKVYFTQPGQSLDELRSEAQGLTFEHPK